jgi:hypothetical protein
MTNSCGLVYRWDAVSGEPQLDLIVTMDDATGTMYWSRKGHGIFVSRSGGGVRGQGTAAGLYSDRASHYF